MSEINNISKQAKYLLLGGKGQLGKEFEEFFISNDIKFESYDIDTVDIADIDSINAVLKHFKPDFLINCAAYNLVDKAETEFDKPYSVNTKGPHNIALLSDDYKFKAVHYSSDYVFDGKKNSKYSENDEPMPLNNYGKTKLEGEQLFLNNSFNNIVFRLSWVYGNGKQNFIYKLLDWASKQQVLRIAKDETSVPTSTKFIVENTLLSLNENLQGLFHLTPQEDASRYDWACEILRLFAKENQIEPASIKDFNLAALRPENSAMESENIQYLLGKQFNSWKDYLNEYAIHYKH